MSAFTVRVVNDTGEELTLDAASVDDDAWNGEWVLPRRIRAHASAILWVTDGAPPGDASDDESSVSYLIGGDPDRPVYVHVIDAADESVEVWTAPVCRTRIEDGGAEHSVRVRVRPVEHRAAA